MMKLSAPPKPRTQPTHEGSNQESSYGYQHLWLRPQPTTSSVNEEFSHGDGNPHSHVGKIGRQHNEDCSHYPADHETNVYGMRASCLPPCLEDLGLGGEGGLSRSQKAYSCAPFTGRLALCTSLRELTNGKTNPQAQESEAQSQPKIGRRLVQLPKEGYQGRIPSVAGLGLNQDTQAW